MDSSDNIYCVESAVSNLFSLTQEGSHLCRIIAKASCTWDDSRTTILLSSRCRWLPFVMFCLSPPNIKMWNFLSRENNQYHRLLFLKFKNYYCIGGILSQNVHFPSLYLFIFHLWLWECGPKFTPPPHLCREHVDQRKAGILYPNITLILLHVPSLAEQTVNGE